ncbi:MAG: cyclic nucleotide-binding domain-containing protein [Rhodospirillales bacterium]|nr:cyclic nucleotide-binding domain-containing protein [Rhodospirillales bacterium]
MSENYKIAVIGSGPSGMSAGGRAAERGVSHVVLERSDHLSDTIYKYQKGKHVMATPEVLPLRSSMTFGAAKRETVLETWNKEAQGHKVNVRFNAQVTGITGAKGRFDILINNKETITAESIVMAIGLQGNLRKLEIEGADWDRVQYQLDDPEEYEDERIVVVGAGDAGIENAIALAKQNRVVIINRQGEFARVKDANKALIEAAIEKGEIECFYSATPARLTPGALVLDVPQGQATVQCDRIIARLGAIPPRAFVERAGIVFPSKSQEALPELSPQYESNVPGLYVIGALGGYPLIKQAMNQGYEVIEFILGNNIKPADEPLLERKFGALLQRYTVDQVIDLFREKVPLLSGLTALQLREFLIDGTVHLKAPGEIVFERNDYTTSLYMIVEGNVNVHVDPNDFSVVRSLKAGQFFGELGMIAGRRRTASITAADQCLLIESPARTMIKLINSVESVRRAVNDEGMARQIRAYLSHEIKEADLAGLIKGADRRSFKAETVFFNEGDESDGVYLITQGSITVSRNVAGKNIVLAYVPAGHYVGEMGVVGNAPRDATIRAAIDSKAIFIPKPAFLDLIEKLPSLRRRMEEEWLRRLAHKAKMTARPEAGSIIQFLIEQGAGEATDMLLIDESLCIRCNNCEIACAETHGGTSRLDREAGPTVANVHVPTSCRHCEDPHCMTECPPDAIHRSPNGEVFIDSTCIGCGNCERNCPYGVIHMAEKEPAKPGLLSWMLFGMGSGPGQDKARKKDKKDGSEGPKLAVKCDMCKDQKSGPACVASCPTGAAFRVSPEAFFSGHLTR